MNASINADYKVEAAGTPDRQATPLQALISWSLLGVSASAKSDCRVRAVALGLALVAHLVVLYILMRPPDELLAGGAGQIDTISVTIVSSKVLESRELDHPQPIAPAASNPVDATEGVPESSPAAAEQHEETKDTETPQEEKKRPEEPVRTAEAIFEVPKKVKPQRKQEASAPAVGGSAARSETPTQTNSSGVAAASAGAIREYARYVSQALSKTKPKGTGGLGTAMIKFVIAADGSLASAEIAKSSGSTKLDVKALEAVRHAKFPSPPPGMTVVQLTYEVPYHFR